MHTDPAPWDDVEAALDTIPTLDDAQERALVEAIPDDARAVMLTFRDPDAVARFAREGRALMTERVRGLLLAQHAKRLDVGGRATPPAVVAPEVRLGADIIDTLEAVRSIAQAGIDEAKQHALDCLDEVTAVKPVGTTSLPFPDQHGGQVKVTAEQATSLEVDVDELVDVVAAMLAARERDETYGEIPTHPHVDVWREAAAAGARHVLSLLKPSWKATALKALASDLAAQGSQEAADLGVRLELATRRAPVGNLRVKITRTDTEKGTAR